MSTDNLKHLKGEAPLTVEDPLLFEVDTHEVAIRLAAWGGCVVLGESYTGKARLMREAEHMVKKVWEQPTLFIDGNTEGVSPIQLTEAEAQLSVFQSTHGEHGVVFVSHLDAILRQGHNDALNQARDGFLDTLYDIVASRAGTAAICVASQRRIAETSGLMGHFPECSQYDFTGALTECSATAALSASTPFDEDRINALSRRLAKTNELSYQMVARIAEGSATAHPRSAGSPSTSHRPAPKPPKEVKELERWRQLRAKTASLVGLAPHHY